jgi:hypothetical protein
LHHFTVLAFEAVKMAHAAMASIQVAACIQIMQVVKPLRLLFAH